MDVKKILSEMTLEEKTGLGSGRDLRMSTSSEIDERTLREIYLAAKEGNYAY